VEKKYKSWFGVTQLVADHTQNNLEPKHLESQLNLS